MKRLCLVAGVLASLICTSLKTQAQAPAPPQPWQDRLFLGGNLGGLSFSSQGSAIDLSPVIGYRVTEKFSAGAGPIYQFWSNRSAGIRVNNYGAKVFARHAIYESLFAHTEYELLNLQYYYPDMATGQWLSERRNVGSFYVGGGYNQSLGGRSSLQIMALYNLNQTQYSPHPNPLYFSMGFGIGL